jgi:hypothetical protein
MLATQQYESVISPKRRPQDAPDDDDSENPEKCRVY